MVAALLALLAAVPDAAWTQNIDALSGQPRADLAATVYNGRLYVAGGYSATAATASITVSPLGGDGSIGSPVSTTPLNFASGAIGIAVLNNFFYVAGGNISEVDYAPVNGDGTLGAFTSTNPLSRAPYGQGLIEMGGQLFAPGGAHVTGSGPSATFQYFTNFSIGSPQSGPAIVWADEAPGLPSPRAHFGLATDGVSFYLAGGESDSAVVGADVIYGTGGSAWALAGSLPSERSGAAAFVSGGFLFVIGGLRIQDTTPLADVLQARILSDGKLGHWIRTASLHTARHLHAAVTNLGYAYVIGGFGSDYLSDVEWKKLTTPGPAANLALDGAPASANLGECVGPITVSLTDASQNPTWADADISVGITTGGAFVASKADCSDQNATSVQINGGTDSVKFYVKFGTAGEKAISAATAALATANTSLTVAGSPDDPHTVNGWGCSSAPAGWLALLALLVAKRNRRVEA